MENGNLCNLMIFSLLLPPILSLSLVFFGEANFKILSFFTVTTFEFNFFFSVLFIRNKNKRILNLQNKRGFRHSHTKEPEKIAVWKRDGSSDMTKKKNKNYRKRKKNVEQMYEPLEKECVSNLWMNEWEIDSYGFLFRRTATSSFFYYYCRKCVLRRPVTLRMVCRCVSMCASMFFLSSLISFDLNRYLNLSNELVNHTLTTHSGV